MTGAVGSVAGCLCGLGSASHTLPRTTPVIPASAASMWVPGQVGSEEEAGVGRLAPGALARVGQAILTGQAPGDEECRARSLHSPVSPQSCHTSPTLAPWAQSASLAAEWWTLLQALQGTSAPAPPVAPRIPFAVKALMPLTEGVLGGCGGMDSQHPAWRLSSHAQ